MTKLSTKLVIGVSGGLLVITTGAALLFFYTGGSKESIASCYQGNIKSQALLSLTNRDRASRGLTPLKENQQLDEVASQKAQDMITTHYWAHNSPSGVTPWNWFKKVGYTYTFAGENLAQDAISSEGVEADWMRSPEHRENIVNPHYAEVGYSVVCGRTNKQTTLVVAEYASR